MRYDAGEVLTQLKERGHRMTEPRRAIVEAIMATQGHLTPQGIIDRVKGDMPGVNPSTVYRTMELLEEIGVLAHSHLDGGAEYHHAGEQEHVHLVCARCGRTQSLPADDVVPLRNSIAAHTGFEPDFTHFAISGLCSECSAAIS